MASTFASRFDKAIADSAALCAVVGAGDLAVEKLKEAREKFDAKELKDQAQAKLHASVEALQSDVRISPEQVMDLPVRMQAAMSDLLSSTSTTYDDLVVRGRDIVDRMRHQQQHDDATTGTPVADPPAEDAGSVTVVADVEVEEPSNEENGGAATPMP